MSVHRSGGHALAGAAPPGAFALEATPPTTRMMSGVDRVLTLVPGAGLRVAQRTMARSPAAS